MIHVLNQICFFSAYDIVGNQVVKSIQRALLSISLPYSYLLFVSQTRAQMIVISARCALWLAVLATLFPHNMLSLR